MLIPRKRRRATAMLFTALLLIDFLKLTIYGLLHNCFLPAIVGDFYANSYTVQKQIANICIALRVTAVAIINELSVATKCSAPSCGMFLRLRGKQPAAAKQFKFLAQN